MQRRKYKSGSRFAFWRWTDVDSEYITRLHLIKTPLFAVCLHWINKPDPEPFLHDHPVSFLSLILRGGYTEKRRRWRSVYGFAVPTTKLEEHRWWNWVTANRIDRHTIVRCEPETLTLCLMGPKRQEWGFYDKAGGWTHWKDYYAKQRAEKAKEMNAANQSD